jgi:hypothetical protein
LNRYPVLAMPEEAGGTASPHGFRDCTNSFHQDFHAARLVQASCRV